MVCMEEQETESSNGMPGESNCLRPELLGTGVAGVTRVQTSDMQAKAEAVGETSVCFFGSEDNNKMRPAQEG